MKMDQAKIAEYEAKLIYAKNDYERIDQLYKKGVSTKDEMESALSQYKSYQASLLGAKAEFILSEDDYKHCRIYSPHIRCNRAYQLHRGKLYYAVFRNFGDHHSARPHKG